MSQTGKKLFQSISLACLIVAAVSFLAMVIAMADVFWTPHQTAFGYGYSATVGCLSMGGLLYAIDEIMVIVKKAGNIS